MIHVAFGYHERTGHFAKFIGTAMVSIFENLTTSPPCDKVTIHILHDNTMTDDNRDKFNFLAENYNQQVKFYNVEELCSERVEEFRNKFSKVAKGRWSIGSYYPFFIPNVIPKDIKKIIYLDADIVVNLDINELWQVDLENKTLAVIPNVLTRPKKIYPLVSPGFVKHEDYFNSGVYMMNVEKFMAQTSVIDEGIKFLIENRYPYDDERILNYCFSSDTIKLPMEFNFNLLFERVRRNDVDNKIVHYERQTLNMNCADVYNALFFKYFVKTPWFNEDIFGNLYLGIQKLHDEQKGIMLRIANALSNKKRMFYVTKNLEEKTRKLFEIKDDETVILVDWKNPTELFNLTLLLNKDRGKIIHIFVASGFVKIARQHLIKQGYKEWQDFIDGGIVFSTQNGGVLNTYDIVAGM